MLKIISWIEDEGRWCLYYLPCQKQGYFSTSSIYQNNDNDKKCWRFSKTLNKIAILGETLAYRKSSCGTVDLVVYWWSQKHKHKIYGSAANRKRKIALIY